MAAAPCRKKNARSAARSTQPTPARNRTRSTSKWRGRSNPNSRCPNSKVKSPSTEPPPRTGKALRSSISTAAKPKPRGGPGGCGSGKAPPRKSTGWRSANSTSASGSNRCPRARPAATTSAPTSPGRSRARTTTASGSTKRRSFVQVGRQCGEDGGGNLVSGNTEWGIVAAGKELEIDRNFVGTDATGEAPLPNGPDPEEVEAEGGGIRVGPNAIEVTVGGSTTRNCPTT